MNDARKAGTIVLGDKEYTVERIGPFIVGDLELYLRGAIPDPRLRLKEFVEGVPDAVALAVWKTLHEQAKDWPPRMTSDAGNRELTQTHEGAARVVFAFLRKFNGVTLDRAREIAGEITAAELDRLIRAATAPEAGDER